MQFLSLHGAEWTIRKIESTVLKVLFNDQFSTWDLASDLFGWRFWLVQAGIESQDELDSR